MAALSNLVHPALFYEMCVTMIRMYKDGSYGVIFRNWRRASASSTTTIEPAEPLDYLPAISPTTLVPPELMWEDTDTPELKLSEGTPFTDDTAVTDANREPGDTTLDASQSQENILAFQGDIYTILRRKRRIRNRINEVKQAKDKLEKAASIIHKKGLGARPKTRGKYGRLMTPPPAEDYYRQTPRQSPRGAPREGEDATRKVRLADAMSFSSNEHTLTTTVDEQSVEEASTGIRSTRRAKKSKKKVVVVGTVEDNEESSLSEIGTSEGSPPEARPKDLASGTGSRRMSLRLSSKPPTPIRRGSKYSKEIATEQIPRGKDEKMVLDTGREAESRVTAGKVKTVSIVPEEPFVEPTPSKDIMTTASPLSMIKKAAPDLETIQEAEATVIASKLKAAATSEEPSGHLAPPKNRDKTPSAEHTAALSAIEVTATQQPSATTQDGAQAATVKALGTDVFDETSCLKAQPHPDIIDMYANASVQRSVGLKPTSLKMDAALSMPWQDMPTGDQKPQRPLGVDEHWPSWVNLDYDDHVAAALDKSTEAELLRQKLAAWDPSQEDGYALTPPEEIGEGKDFLEEHDKELAEVTRLSQADFRGGKGPSMESGTKPKLALGRPSTSGDSGSDIYEDLDWVLGDEDVGKSQPRKIPEEAASREFSVRSFRAKPSSEAPETSHAHFSHPSHAIPLVGLPQAQREHLPAATAPFIPSRVAKRPSKRDRAQRFPHGADLEGQLSERSIRARWPKEMTASGSSESSTLLLTTTTQGWQPVTKTPLDKQKRSSPSVALVEWIPEDDLLPCKTTSVTLPSVGEVEKGHRPFGLSSEPKTTSPTDVVPLQGTGVKESSSQKPGSTETPAKSSTKIEKVSAEARAASSTEKPRTASKRATLETTEPTLSTECRKPPASVTPAEVATGEGPETAASKEETEPGRYKDEGTQVTASLSAKRHRKSKGRKKSSTKRGHEEAKALDSGGEEPRKDEQKRKKRRRKSVPLGRTGSLARHASNESQERRRQSEAAPNSARRLTSLDDLNRYLEVIQSQEEVEPWPTFSMSSIASQPRGSIAAQPLRQGEFLRDYATRTRSGEVNLVINANTKNISSMLWPFAISPVPENQPPR